MSPRTCLYKMILKKTIFFFLLLPFVSFGQTNLVPNPGFEDSVYCAFTAGTYRPALWFSPTYGTPDYYNVTSSGNNGCMDDAPSNWGGGQYSNIRGFQLPHTGVAYSGLGIDGSEFLSIHLNDSLKTGKNYVVSFYASLAEASGAGIDSLSFCFRRDSLTTGYTQINLFYDSLQVVAGSQDGSCIIDTAGWVLLRDTFIASGGEIYMIFGNFQYYLSQPQYCTLDSTLPQGSYYYFDDFDVHCIDCSTSIPPVLDYPEITLTPNPSNGEFILKGNFSSDTKLEIFDLLGQQVSNIEIPQGNQDFLISLLLADGVYLFQVKDGDTILKSQKIVIVH